MCKNLPVDYLYDDLPAGARYSLFDNPNLGVVYQVLAWGVGRAGGVLHCDDDSHGYNTSSIVLKIGGNCPNFILTGDATAHTMKYILDTWRYEVLYSAVMSAPHHGSFTTAKGYYVTKINGQDQEHMACPEFFDMLRPRRIVVSAGMHASYGHPHFTMMDYYDFILSTYGNIDKQHAIWTNQNNSKAQNYAGFSVTSSLYTTQLGLDQNTKIFVHHLIESNGLGQVNHMAVPADPRVTQLPNGIIPIENLNGSQRQMGLVEEQHRNIRSCRAVAHKVSKKCR